MAYLIHNLFIPILVAMKKILFIIIGAAIFFVGANSALAGFGITPPYVRSDTLTRGSEFTQKIILVRGNPVEDLKAEITINIPKVGGWFSVDRGNEFILPKGEKQIPIFITVRVPEEAEYDRYVGNIRIRTSSIGDIKAGVSIALGAQVDVDIKVVDHISDFDVLRVELLELEEGHKKWWLDYPGRITFLMHIENTGNVDVAPEKVRFDIYDRKSDRLLESTESINEIQTVAPFDTGKIAAYLPTHLPVGGYKVKYTVYKGEEVVRTGDINMSILPHGLVPNYEPFGFEGLSSFDKATLVGPPIFVVLMIILAILWRRLSKKKRYNKRRNTQKRTSNTPKEQFTKQKSTTAIQKRSVQGNVIDLSRKR